MASAVITVTQSWNRYTYAANNPMRYNDPSGELPANFTKDQIRLFQTLVDQQNTRDGTSLTADQVWASLIPSQQRTFYAVTHALEKSMVTDKKDKTKSVPLITLVSGLKMITGEYTGANKKHKKDGKTQFRLLVSLKEGAVAQIENSNEFYESDASAGHIYKGGDKSIKVRGNIRQREVDGNPTAVQISYDEKNLLEGDIDVDYRQTPSVFDPFPGEGHGEVYNSDVNAVGPEKADGKPINNRERHNKRYGGESPLPDLPQD